MKLKSNGSKLLRGLVFTGCFSMLIIQIIVSYQDYAQFKTVQTTEHVKLTEVEFPLIVICHKKPFNVDMKRLKYGHDDNGNFIGWNGMTDEYLTNITNIGKLFRGVIMTMNYDDIEHTSLKVAHGRMNFHKGICLEAEIG